MSDKSWLVMPPFGPTSEAEKDYYIDACDTNPQAVRRGIILTATILIGGWGGLAIWAFIGQIL